MNLFQKAISWLTPNYSADANKLFQSIYSYFNGRFFTYNTNKETFVRNGYQENVSVYSIIRLISGKVAAARVYGATMNAKGETIPQSKDSYLNKILKRPNEMDRGSQFIEGLVSWLLITGDIYIYKLTYQTGANKGRPAKLYTLPSQYVQIMGGGVNEPVAGYRLMLGNQTVEFAPDEIIHIKYFNPNYDVSGSQLYGQSPLLAALKTMQSSNEAVNAKIKAFINGGVAGLITGDNPQMPLSVEEVAQLNQVLASRVTGTNNSHRISGTNGSVKYQKIGETPVDLQLLDSIAFDRNELCIAFGVDPIIFSVDSASYNNKKEAKKAFINDVVVPILNLITEGLDECFDDSVGIVEYSIAHFPEMQQDLGEMVKSLEMAWWFSPNQKLKMMNAKESTDPLMDKIYIPSTLVPLDQTTLDLNDTLKNFDYPNE